MAHPVFHVFAGDILPIPFATYAGATGASITLTGLAITDVEIYKDVSMTQRASDAGVVLIDTDGIDIDGITGIHGFSIDTSDNTDAGFYTVGAWFTVVVSAVTVDSQTVNFIAAQFRLMAAEAIAGKPKADVDAWLGTAAATPTVNGVPEVDVTHWIGTAAATPTVAGVPEVDATHWNGTAVATPATAGHPVATLKVGTGTGEVNLTSGAVPVKGNVKKNTALAAFMFMMTDSTWHAPATGKTVTCTRSIDGGAFGAGTLGNSGVATEVGVGIYYIDFGAGDLNGNNIILRATATACDDTFERLVSFVA